MIAPKERPLLVSGPLIGPILRGEKTVTRRLAPIRFDTSQKWGPYDCWTFYKGRRPFIGFSESNRGQDLCVPHCSYGRVGDVLWVRETWHVRGLCHTLSIAQSKAAAPDAFVYAATPPANWAGGWRPSIHMPRWAARILLRVESVTVERVQDITHEDAAREGVELGGWMNHRQAFAALWDSLAPAGSKWADNPWVWRIGFALVTP